MKYISNTIVRSFLSHYNNYKDELAILHNTELGFKGNIGLPQGMIKTMIQKAIVLSKDEHVQQEEA